MIDARLYSLPPLKDVLACSLLFALPVPPSQEEKTEGGKIKRLLFCLTRFSSTQLPRKRRGGRRKRNVFFALQTCRRRRGGWGRRKSLGMKDCAWQRSLFPLLCSAHSPKKKGMKKPRGTKKRVTTFHAGNLVGSSLDGSSGPDSPPSGKKKENIFPPFPKRVFKKYSPPRSVSPPPPKQPMPLNRLSGALEKRSEAKRCIEGLITDASFENIRGRLGRRRRRRADHNHKTIKG